MKAESHLQMSAEEQQRNKANRVSIMSVYFQAVSYYDSTLTTFLIPLQLLIFIYKYNILYYDSNVIAGEIILLLLAFAINSIRLSLGRSGNKGKKFLNIVGYLLLSVLIILGFVYVVALQPNILYLEFILFLIALVVIGIEFVLMVILLIIYKVNED